MEAVYAAMKRPRLRVFAIITGGVLRSEPTRKIISPDFRRRFVEAEKHRYVRFFIVGRCRTTACRTLETSVSAEVPVEQICKRTLDLFSREERRLSWLYGRVICSNGHPGIDPLVSFVFSVKTEFRNSARRDL